jgi:hypothetical protein
MCPQSAEFRWLVIDPALQGWDMDRIADETGRPRFEAPIYAMPMDESQAAQKMEWVRSAGVAWVHFGTEPWFGCFAAAVAICTCTINKLCRSTC